MGKRKYSEATKAAAMADLAAGMKVREVAEKYDMPYSTAGDLAPSSKRGTAKIRKIADLQDLEALFRRHLALNFAALEAITDLVRDADWLEKQSADDVTGLYATLFAKSGKLLGALYGPAAQQLEAPDDPEDAA
jgi:hypothetical protein